MNDFARYAALAEKWKNGTITRVEQQELDDWYSAGQDKPVYIPDTVAASEVAHGQLMLDRIKNKIAAKETRITKQWPWRWIAAAVIVLVSAPAIYYTTPNSGSLNKQGSVSLESIQPGSNRATLTLSDGKKIDLSGQQQIRDGDITIANRNSGLVYTKTNTMVFNTMSTPKGGTYQLQLPDGTKVWLNAASGITYPTVFKGNNRTIKLTGEAYFEIAKDKSKPFIVETGTQKIEVLGTHFNVNAYANEPVMQTTLLEGSVKVGNRIIKPGEAWINGEVKKVNTSVAIAWKNGLFHFEDAGLKAVMRQIERWYDIDISFEDQIPDEKFQGELKRNLNLAQIMHLLSYMDIHYRLEENRHLIISGK